MMMAFGLKAKKINPAPVLWEEGREIFVTHKKKGENLERKKKGELTITELNLTDATEFNR